MAGGLRSGRLSEQLKKEDDEKSMSRRKSAPEDLAQSAQNMRRDSNASTTKEPGSGTLLGLPWPKIPVPCKKVQISGVSAVSSSGGSTPIPLAQPVSSLSTGPGCSSLSGQQAPLPLPQALSAASGGAAVGGPSNGMQQLPPALYVNHSNPTTLPMSALAVSTVSSSGIPPIPLAQPVSTLNYHTQGSTAVTNQLAMYGGQSNSCVPPAPFTVAPTQCSAIQGEGLSTGPASSSSLLPGQQAPLPLPQALSAASGGAAFGGPPPRYGVQQVPPAFYSLQVNHSSVGLSAGPAGSACFNSGRQATLPLSQAATACSMASVPQNNCGPVQAPTAENGPMIYVGPPPFGGSQLIHPSLTGTVYAVNVGTEGPSLTSSHLCNQMQPGSSQAPNFAASSMNTAFIAPRAQTAFPVPPPLPLNYYLPPAASTFFTDRHGAVPTGELGIYSWVPNTLPVNHQFGGQPNFGGSSRRFAGQRRVSGRGRPGAGTGQGTRGEHGAGGTRGGRVGRGGGYANTRWVNRSPGNGDRAIAHHQVQVPYYIPQVQTPQPVAYPVQLSMPNAPCGHAFHGPCSHSVHGESCCSSAHRRF